MSFTFAVNSLNVIGSKKEGWVIKNQFSEGTIQIQSQSDEDIYKALLNGKYIKSKVKQDMIRYISIDDCTYQIIDTLSNKPLYLMNKV